MRVRAVVVDFDGTIAADQRPLENAALLAALRELKAAGVSIVLNTGRDLPYALSSQGILRTKDLQLFDAIIVENGGAVWYAGEVSPRPLTTLWSPELLHEIRRVGVPSDVLWPGMCAIMSTRDNSQKIWRAINNVNRRREAAGRTSLHLVESVNGRSICFLPPGINKGSALVRVVANSFGIPLHEVVGAGDGLNDISFLSLCGAAIVPSTSHPHNRTLHNAIVTNGESVTALASVLRQIARNNLQLDTHQHNCRDIA